MWTANFWPCERAVNAQRSELLTLPTPISTLSSLGSLIIILLTCLLLAILLYYYMWSQRAMTMVYARQSIKSAEATRITHWPVDSEITQQRVGQCRFYHIKAAHKSSELYNFYALIITCPGNFITGIFHLSAVDQSEFTQHILPLYFMFFLCYTI